MMILVDCRGGSRIPVVVGADPSGWGGAPTCDFTKFSKILHKMEDILDVGGAPDIPLNPPIDWIYIDKFWTRPRSNFIQFHAVFLKFWPINNLASPLRLTTVSRKSWIRHCVLPTLPYVQSRLPSQNHKKEIISL